MIDNLFRLWKMIARRKLQMSRFNKEKNNSFIKLVNRPSCISSIKPVPVAVNKGFVYVYSLGVRKDSVKFV